MILTPASEKDLSRGLSHAFALGERVEQVDLTAMNRVVEHAPEDMTVTLEAGITLANLQKELGKRGQWLPIDPPRPGQLSLGELLAGNLSGPRRFGCGTIREHLIGLKVVLADGTVVKSGGKVVKNVAGYDLAKLFIGARGSLGVISEATFKLRPLPEMEEFVGVDCEPGESARTLIDSILDSELTPVVLDLHNRESWETKSSSRISLVVGLAGTREEVVWQVDRARQLGLAQPASLDHEVEFWSNPAPAQRLSVLPSNTVDAVARLGPVPFVARAGNGVIHHRGPAGSRKMDFPAKLTRRLKEAFDPKHILPEFNPGAAS